MMPKKISRKAIKRVADLRELPGKRYRYPVLPSLAEEISQQAAKRMGLLRQKYRIPAIAGEILSGSQLTLGPTSVNCQARQVRPTHLCKDTCAIYQ